MYSNLSGNFFSKYFVADLSLKVKTQTLTPFRNRRILVGITSATKRATVSVFN